MCRSEGGESLKGRNQQHARYDINIPVFEKILLWKNLIY
jgi:hypothetical protein